MDTLPVFWFIAIAALWAGYLLLEGFDLGVGMRMLFASRTEKDRRVMLNTIGPVWDGNEVWLITAGAAMFAAFPYWYAALFSALYVPLTIALVGLIARAVGIEYRGKVASRRWATFWTAMIGLGSAIAAFCIGAALADRKSTRLNSSHVAISYAVFCLKKKKKHKLKMQPQSNKSEYI